MKLAFVGAIFMVMSASALAQQGGPVSTAAIAPPDRADFKSIPVTHGVLPALPLLDERNNPIGYSLSTSVSARPATIRNTLGQLTGSLVGGAQAENSRILFLYDISSEEELSTLLGAASDQDRPYVVYVLARNRTDENLMGAPVVLLPDFDLPGEQNLDQANRIAYDAISWGISRGYSESGALTDDGRLLLAVSAMVPGLPAGEKVIASGSPEWNVYSDVKFVTDAVQDLAASAPR
ncbi:hypothetical protein EJC49_14070 [Aquibium carbonis]|uniref:Uncharacterized protein n=1 Tax=Aquibium carbonis TaxID=2495581 RepID=A0A3R9YEA4_9HYPH|nr:hypothetical protein [Aquibium carbonis]RST85669.1 hypothetical protein EJC49_14070 [Aquibium carbonis]